MGGDQTSKSFRVRLRFRVEKRLQITEPSYNFTIEGQPAVLTADVDNENIDTADWLVINVKGIAGEAEAAAFADRLKAAVDVSSVAARLGVDTGINSATSTISTHFKEHLAVQDVIVRNDIHGIDVFGDDARVRFLHMRGELRLLKQPAPFLDDITQLMAQVGKASQATKDMVLLLNYALMRKDPVAQIVFAFSAVEMVGQMRKWSPSQAALLEHLATLAKKSSFGTQEERDAVATAISNSIHPKSLRQGVLGLMKELSLDHLKNDWDDLYKQRSTLVHGLAPRPGVDYEPLAFKAVSICGIILLTAIGREIPAAMAHIEQFYVPQGTSYRYFPILLEPPPAAPSE